MKKCSVALLFLISLSVSAMQKNELVYNITPGEKVIFQHLSRIAAGYHWYTHSGNSQIVKLLHTGLIKKDKSSSKLMGNTQIRYWEFEGVNAGEATFVLKNFPPSEKTPETVIELLFQVGEGKKDKSELPSLTDPFDDL